MEGDDVYHTLEQRHLELLKDHQNSSIENSSLQGKVAAHLTTINQLQLLNEELQREKDLTNADLKQVR
jgi:hypothetical protein